MVEGSAPPSAPQRSAEVESHLAEGRSRLKESDPEGAASAFSRGLALAPSDPDLLFLRGLARLRKKDHAGAAEDNEAALRAKPDFHDARYNLGLCWFNLGQNEQACEEFTRF